MAQNVSTPVSRAANQRFYNKASGHMETRQQMHNYRVPPGHVPPGHQIQRTNTTTTHPPIAPTPPVDLAHMNQSQLLAFAKKVVGDELNAGRLPFQQQEATLQGQQGATEEHAKAESGQLNTYLQGLSKSSAQHGAEFEQRAQANRAEIEKAPTSGGGAMLQEQRARQEAFAKAVGGASVSQAQNARAANEQWATTQQAGYAQAGTAAVQKIASKYAEAKGKNRDEEAAYLAKGQGEQTKLFMNLYGEQQKLKEASRATGLREVELYGKERQNALKNQLTARGQNATRAGQKESNERGAAEGAAGRRLQSASDAETARHNKAMEAAKRLTDAAKKKGAVSAKQEALHGEVGSAYSAFEQLVREAVGKGTAGKHAKPGVNAQTNHEIMAKVRSALKSGKAGELQAKDPVAIQAGQELWYTHKVSKATRAALGRKGINIGYDPEIYKAVSGQ